MDFNDTPIEVTMAAGSSVVTADIPIVDDEINEAEEEFVVVLEVVSNTTNPVVFTTQTTVCRIPPSDRKCQLKCNNWVSCCLSLNCDEDFSCVTLSPHCIVFVYVSVVPPRSPLFIWIRLQLVSTCLQVPLARTKDHTQCNNWRVYFKRGPSSAKNDEVCSNQKQIGSSAKMKAKM